MLEKTIVCPKCRSENVVDINPDLRKTVKKPIAYINAKCNDCDFEFVYSSITEFGKRKKK